MRYELETIRLIADFQFGAGVGAILFPDSVVFELSSRTGWVRRVYHNGRLLATLRPSDGMLALTLEGARRLRLALPADRLRVRVADEAVEFIKKGSDVFSKHVVQRDPQIVPREEVIVEDSRGELIAVGRAVISGLEMGMLKRGVAVKVRQGILEEGA